MLVEEKLDKAITHLLKAKSSRERGEDLIMVGELNHVRDLIEEIVYLIIVNSDVKEYVE